MDRQLIGCKWSAAGEIFRQWKPYGKRGTHVLTWAFGKKLIALNFKQPNIKEETVKGITEKTRQSRAKFAYDVPDVEGRGASYVHAKARLKKTKLPDLEKLPLSDVIALGEQLEARKRGLARFNPLPILPEGSGEAEEALVPLTMFPIVDSNGFSDLLIGPHVPTVEND
jgi:hypothetical protein